MQTSPRRPKKQIPPRLLERPPPIRSSARERTQPSRVRRELMWHHRREPEHRLIVTQSPARTLPSERKSEPGPERTVVLSTTTALAAKAGPAPTSVQAAMNKPMAIGCILLISSLSSERAEHRRTQNLTNDDRITLIAQRFDQTFDCHDGQASAWP